tara:strand:- start:1079 stop:1198 length:120 start_codon:yes stop_codon:yes gene_type:complete
MGAIDVDKKRFGAADYKRSIPLPYKRKTKINGRKKAARC